jgi:predicted transcriptional regulator of viral defense system
MKTSIIWERFLVEDRRMVTSREIGELAEEMSKDPDQVIDYLQSNDYIARVLRGIFYVKSREERGRGVLDRSLYEIVAMALEMKGIRRWYFGLETALKLNLMTHEFFVVDYVLTDSYRTTKTIRIMGTAFRFIKRGERHFRKGIVRRGLLRYSDPERTVLDLAYREYLRSKEPSLFMSPVVEHREVIDVDRMRELLEDYPPGFMRPMEGLA